MMGVMIVAATAALGIDYGWQPVAGGGIEYIIQIEPEMLESLRAGEDIFSDMPPAHEVRSWRITVGTERLPHQDEPPPQSKPKVDSALPSDFDRSSIPLPGPDLNPQREDDREELRTTRPDRNRLRPSRDSARNDEDDRDARSMAEPRHVDEEVEQAVATGTKAKPKEPGGAGRKGAKSASDGDDEEEDDRGDHQNDREKSSLGATDRPWVPLSMALLGLFASLGGNAYLIWVTAGMRHHYRTVLRQSALVTNQLSSSLSDDADRIHWENP